MDLLKHIKATAAISSNTREAKRFWEPGGTSKQTFHAQITPNLTDDLEPNSESNRVGTSITGIETGWQDPSAGLYQSGPRRNTHDSHVTVDSNELGLADGEPISPFSWYSGFVVNSDLSPESVHQTNTEGRVSQAGIQNAFSVPADVSELPNAQVDEPHFNDFLVLQWSQNASTLFCPALSQNSDPAFDQPQQALAFL
jgi:hypothetical protein